MSEQTWIDPRVERQHWPAGEWDSEPDKVQWTDADTGLVCLAKRVPWSGHWCGYVGVSDDHPWHGKGYSDDIVTASAHGGLTYADKCQEGKPEQTVCHIPEPGEPDSLWWFGFDCAHSGDSTIYDISRGRMSEYYASYKSLGYVKSECRSLARQIKNAAP